MEDVNFFVQNIFCFTGGFIGGLFLGYIALCINAIWLSALKFFK